MGGGAGLAGTWAAPKSVCIPAWAPGQWTCVQGCVSSPSQVSVLPVCPRLEGDDGALQPQYGHLGSSFLGSCTAVPWRRYP